ncbi:MAG: hypothetical protein ACFFGZ_02055, partial [Candidatus Thorarchaeota archaeon]
ETEEADSPPDSDLTASEPPEEKPEVIEEPSPSIEPSEETEEASSPPDSEFLSSESNEEKPKESPAESKDIGES